MRRMGRHACAIGFAVYLDEIERLFDRGSSYDVDCVLLYDEKDTIEKVSLLLVNKVTEARL